MLADIISLLPIEISINIFSYLDSYDLLNCCLVSKKWAGIANHKLLWRKCCERYFFKPLSRKGNDAMLDWKSVFKENHLLISNWKGSNKIEYEFEEKRKVIHGSSTDGNVLVLGFGKSEKFQPSELHVFDVERKSLLRRQIINLEDGSLTFSNSSYYIAVQYSKYISIYHCKRRYFNFVYNIYWQDGEFHFASSKKTPKLRPVHNVIEGYSFLTFIEFCGDVLYIYLPSMESLLIWDLCKKKKLDLVQVSTDFCHIVKHGLEVMAPLKESIIVLEKGVKKRVLEGKGLLFKILCNRRVIVGCFLNNHEVWVWEKKSGSLLYKTKLSVPEEAILHPLHEAVIYSCYDWQPVFGEPGMHIKAVQLSDQTNMWSTSTSCLDLDALDVVCGSLLVLRTRFFNLTEGISVVDLITGKCVSSQQFSDNTEILTLRDKFIVVVQSQNYNYHYSSFKVNIHLYYF